MSERECGCRMGLTVPHEHVPGCCAPPNPIHNPSPIDQPLTDLAANRSGASPSEMGEVEMVRAILGSRIRELEAEVERLRYGLAYSEELRQAYDSEASERLEKLERLERQMADQGEVVSKAYAVGLAMGQRLDNPQPNAASQSRSEDSIGSADTAECRHPESGGLVDNTRAALIKTRHETFERSARAAIRAVAEWLEQERGMSPVTRHLRAELEKER